MVYPHAVVLAEEAVALHTEHKIVFQGVEQRLVDVTHRTVLLDYHCAGCAVFEREHSSVFLDVAHLFVVDVVVVRVEQVVLVVPEVLRPGLVVGDDLPIALPSLAVSSPSVVSVDQHQIEFIAVFVVFRQTAVLVELQRLVELALQGGLIVVLLVGAVGEGVWTILVELFYELFEV